MKALNETSLFIFTCTFIKETCAYCSQTTLSPLKPAVQSLSPSSGSQDALHTIDSCILLTAAGYSVAAVAPP